MVTIKRWRSIFNVTNRMYLLGVLSVLVLYQLWDQNRQLSKFSNSFRRIKRDMFYFFNPTILVNINTSYPDQKVKSHVDQQNYVFQASHIRRTKTGRRIARPFSCNSCFVHNFDYVLNNRDICNTNNGDASIWVVILIFSTHANFNRRKALRETWLLPSRRNLGNFRYAFLLGMSQNNSLQLELEKESAIHKDIVQENFIDSYFNLTYKAVMAMKWVSTYCNEAQYMMKTDDDMYVNTDSLKIALDQYEDLLYESIGGYCWTRATPLRQRSSKWYASYRMYPQKIYPGFCSGTGYVTSVHMARKLFEISPHVPFFHLEDVYMGLCVYALGLTVTSIKGFNLDRVPLGCDYKSKAVITSHQLEPDLLISIWHLNC